MAVEEGYRLVDTASMYRNEDGVGAALLGRRDVFVTTKLGNSDHGFDEALRAFDASMRRLRRDRLDLYLIHWPRPRVNRYVEAWKALVRLQKDGRVRSIRGLEFQPGLSRTGHRGNRRHARGQPDRAPSAVSAKLVWRAFHDQVGIKTELWSPLGRGGLLSESAIGDIAAKHSKTPAQVVIRWHLDSGLIVIPKDGPARALKENIGALDFRLTATTWRGSMRSIRPAAGSDPHRGPRLFKDGFARQRLAPSRSTAG